MFQDGITELAIPNPFGAPVWYAETLSSTMDAARRLASQGTPHGTVITADFQEAGKGRTGRLWQTTRGENLLFTLLLRYPGPGAVPAALTLKAGLGVSRGIEDFLPNRGVFLTEKIQIKWPNDIMLGNRKVVGILAEGDGACVYIGVGVNLGQTAFPDALRAKATSLALACGGAVTGADRFRLLEALLPRLFEALTADADWQVPLLERLYMRGKPVRFIPGAPDSSAAVAVDGILSGVGPWGELLITPPGASKPAAFTTGELAVYETVL